MKLFELQDVPVSFIQKGDKIIMTQKGFKSSSNDKEAFARKNIKDIEGYVGEIWLDLKSYDDYAVVSNVHVVSDMRGRGLGKALYNEALKVAKKKGKIGIASNEYMRNKYSDPIWKKYSNEYDEELDLDIIRKPIR